MATEHYLEFERPILELTRRIQELEEAARTDEKMRQQVQELRERCAEMKRDIYAKLTPAQRVMIARHPQRPYAMDYINGMVRNFVELHGDRGFKDDLAVVCGMGEMDINGKTVAVALVGQQKGRSLDENLKRNFACMNPEGYRKALRVMRLAEKFSMPIVSFIDTMGAYPGIGAEERGQAEAIARNLRDMSVLATPIVCVVIGEGGSGGALGIGVGDRLLMLEHAWYSVISPEGCASILFRDSTKWQEAAEALKFTAADLHRMKIVDEIIPEPLGGAHRDVPEAVTRVREAVTRHLRALLSVKPERLVRERYLRYRSIGSKMPRGKV